MRYQQPKESYEYTKTRIIHEHFNTEQHIVGASPRTSMQILRGPSLSTPETIQDILLKMKFACSSYFKLFVLDS